MRELLLDTDIIIDTLKGYSPAIEFVKTLDDINISLYTALELVNGCKNKEEVKQIKILLSELTIIYSGIKGQQRALKILSKFKSTSGIGLIDCLISGLVIENEFLLVTRNVKHFNSIVEMEIYTPY